MFLHFDLLFDLLMTSLERNWIKEQKLSDNQVVVVRLYFLTRGIIKDFTLSVQN